MGRVGFGIRVASWLGGEGPASPPVLDRQAYNIFELYASLWRCWSRVAFPCHVKWSSVMLPSSPPPVLPQGPNSKTKEKQRVS